MSVFAESTPPAAVRDAAVAVLWLVINGALFVAAWRWSRRLFPRDPFLERVGHAVILCWAGVVLVATALGAAHTLSGVALLIGTGGVSGVALLFSRAQPLAAPAPAVSGDQADKAWLTAWGALWAFWVGHVVTNGLAEFPRDWDSLAYHIPLVDRWVQSGSLWATGSDRWANPGNNELIALWLVAPFSGDFLVALNNGPAVLLLGCSGVALASRMGLSRGLSHLTGLVVSAHFVVFRQLGNQENDVAVVACFLAALGYVFRDQGEGRRDRRVRALGAVALGLLAGVKYYALGYAALAFAVWLAMDAAARGGRSAARVLAAGLVGLLVLGGFWYVRNWVATGTPFYPKGFLGSVDLLDTTYPDAYKSSFFGNGSPGLLELFVAALRRQAGPCPLAAFALTPVSVGWLLVSAAHKFWRGTEPAAARARLGLVAVLVGAGFLFGITPVAVEDVPGTLNQLRWGYCPVRYGLCFLAVATVAAVVVTGDLTRWVTGGDPRGRMGRSAGGLLLALPVLLQIASAVRAVPLSWAAPCLVAANLLVFVLPAFWAPSIRPRGGTAGALVVAILVGGSWTVHHLSKTWHTGFVANYERNHPFGGLGVYARTVSDPNVVLMLGPRCYPYFGPAREHRLYQPVYAPSGEWLMRLIRSEGIRIIVAETMLAPRANLRFAAFEDCLRAHPTGFRLLYDGGYSVIYEVIDEPQ